MAYSTVSAKMQFHVADRRHLRKCAITSATYKPPAVCGCKLRDEDLTNASVERIIKCDRLPRLGGSSMRDPHRSHDDPTARAPSQLVARLPGTRTERWTIVALEIVPHIGTRDKLRENRAARLAELNPSVLRSRELHSGTPAQHALLDQIRGVR